MSVRSLAQQVYALGLAAFKARAEGRIMDAFDAEHRIEALQCGYSPRTRARLLLEAIEAVAQEEAISATPAPFDNAWRYAQQRAAEVQS